MRAMALAAMGVLMGAGLAGCDQTPAPQQQTAQIAPAAPAAPAPCHCGERAVPDTHMTRLSYAPRHRYRHRHMWGYHGSGTSRSEESVFAYDYVSSSRVSYSESSESYESGGSYVGGGYEANGYYAHGHRYYPNGIVWVDGYGRGYFAGQRPTVAQEMTGKRQSVWHGYDKDCPEHPIQSDGY
ncbi:MAG: hypothetical protein ACTHLR_12510 [Rhizomicrobium sp.]